MEFQSHQLPQLQNQINISNLPNDIIEYILRYLNIYDLASQNEVSHQWKKICPSVIIQKSIYLNNQINYEKNRKYNIYDLYSLPCINSACNNNEIGYSVVYFPNESISKTTKEDQDQDQDQDQYQDQDQDQDQEDEYFGPLDYPIYRYETPIEYDRNIFKRAEVCQRSPYIKHNLLYCQSCINKFNILPRN